MWDNGWEEVFRSRDWGQYPSVDVVRFIMRNFGAIPDRSKTKILEIGCGTGANLWFVAREGFRAHGIDGSAAAVRRLEQRFRKENLACEAQVGDAADLPYPDGLFDCVIDCECLYSNSMADARLMLAEARRVLQDGGKLLSITFATGTTGEGAGDTLEGEPNTYTQLHSGAIRTDCGIVRFTSEKDIESLYGSLFTIENIELLTRTEANRSQNIKEWIVSCSKKE